MLIQTQNLTKRYGDKTVVQQLNLSIPQGQLVALLGPNGAGKSTTIKMLTGLLSPSEGSIIFQGQQLSRSDYQRQLGVVFQDSILDQDLTVGQNLLNRAKCYRNFEASQLDFLIQVFELESILKQSYGTLSGGQRRRVEKRTSLEDNAVERHLFARGNQNNLADLYLVRIYFLDFSVSLHIGRFRRNAHHRRD